LPVANGDYYAITDINGCTSDTSNVISILTTGVNDDSRELPVIIYPNPVSNTLYIDGVPAISQVLICNVSGSLLLAKQLCGNQLEIGNLAKGMYFIKFNTPEGTIVRKFVKE